MTIGARTIANGLDGVPLPSRSPALCPVLNGGRETVPSDLFFGIIASALGTAGKGRPRASPNAAAGSVPQLTARRSYEVGEQPLEGVFVSSSVSWSGNQPIRQIAHRVRVNCDRLAFVLKVDDDGHWYQGIGSE